MSKEFAQILTGQSGAAKSWPELWYRKRDPLSCLKNATIPTAGIWNANKLKILKVPDRMSSATWVTKAPHEKFGDFFFSFNRRSTLKIGYSAFCMANKKDSFDKPT